MEGKKKLIKEIIYLAIIYLTHTIYKEGGKYDELMIFLERICCLLIFVQMRILIIHKMIMFIWILKGVCYNDTSLIKIYKSSVL